MALQRFPGLIDMHVHMRDPGQTNKEDFFTGTRSALSGGFTTVVDMPNNLPHPMISASAIEIKKARIKATAACDVGLYYGTDGSNTDTFPEIHLREDIYGLKVYCGTTTGNLLITDQIILQRIFAMWNSTKPILVHAEGDMLAMCIQFAARHLRRIHVCHVAAATDLEQVIHAKEKKLPITCGVTPHHLFLTPAYAAALAAYARVKPPIGSENDRAFLWAGLKKGTIDVVESDHAPHTKEEKNSSPDCFGVPGLETTLGLLLFAVKQNQLTVPKVLDLLYETPKKLLGIPFQQDTYIALDPDAPYKVGASGYETKCGWSPFDGWELFGKVNRVVLRGKPLVADGKVV